MGKEAEGVVGWREWVVSVGIGSDSYGRQSKIWMGREGNPVAVKYWAIM